MSLPIKKSASTENWRSALSTYCGRTSDRASAKSRPTPSLRSRALIRGDHLILKHPPDRLAELPDVRQEESSRLIVQVVVVRADRLEQAAQKGVPAQSKIGIVAELPNEARRPELPVTEMDVEHPQRPSRSVPPQHRSQATRAELLTASAEARRPGGEAKSDGRGISHRSASQLGGDAGPRRSSSIA
jgi:hypothetical protein